MPQGGTNAVPTGPVSQILPPVLPIFAEIPDNPGPGLATHQGPNIIFDDDDVSIATIFCFGAFANRNNGIVYQDLTGSFPFMSFDGNV